MSQYALIAPSIQIAGNVVTRNRKSVVNLSVAEHFHDQLMADPMENVLSCAAVLARHQGTTGHSPDVFGVGSDV